MKKFLQLLIFTALTATFLNVRGAGFISDDSTRCKLLTDSFNTSFRNHNYEAALPVFRILFSVCGNMNKTILNRGIVIYKSLCADEKNIPAKGNCMDTLIAIYEKLHRIDPSGNTALNLAKSFSEKSDFIKAGTYFKEAMDLESDPFIKAEILMALAEHEAYRLHDFPSGRTDALRAMVLRPQWYKPYFFIANLYSTSAEACKKDDLKGQSVYWAAVDKLMDGIAADTSSKSKAEPLIAAYSKKFPDKNTLIKAGIKEGDIYFVKCWINEKTRIRIKL